MEKFEALVVKDSENSLEETSKILGNRLQTIDKALRLKGFIGVVSPEAMEKVEQALKLVLVLK